jgi:hypothetical protein
MTLSRWSRVGAWTTSVALGAALASGIGWAAASGSSTGSATPSASPSASKTTHAASGRAKRGGRLLRRTEHGQLTLRTKTGTTTVDLQRGTVSAVSASSVSVTSKDGHRATYAVSSTSKVRVAGKTASITDVHDGDRVLVLGSAGHLQRLGDPQRAKASSGT